MMTFFLVMQTKHVKMTEKMFWHDFGLIWAVRLMDERDEKKLRTKE